MRALKNHHVFREWLRWKVVLIIILGRAHLLSQKQFRETLANFSQSIWTMASEMVETMAAHDEHVAVEASSEQRSANANGGEDEGVEVVMDSQGKPAIMDRSVFRAPHPVRPRAMRGGPPPHVQTSGSYGYPPHDYHGRPYPVPYGLSGSFDEGASFSHPPPPPHSHYSPQVQYHSQGGRHPEDVNVISPHHGTPKPGTPSRRGYGHYQYPPASPVSRPGDSAHSPPRVRNYAMRRPDAPYSAATRGHAQAEDGAWNYAGTSSDRRRPPLVAEESFDSEPYSSRAPHSSPTTPNAPHYGPPMHAEPQYSGSFYGASFGGSFDSHGPSPPHYDDHRAYYGHSGPYSHPLESPYSPYAAPYNGYSPSGGYYDAYSPHSDYHRGYDGHPNAVSPHDRTKDASSGMLLLPKAAEEIDFDVSDPPSKPHTPPSKTPVCESPADVNSFDVLCGRGGGTNSQVGNRRFRQLVQDFQPIYLLARRKEKPLLARTIVLIIRKRGGRFLKKDEETGELFEVGDTKAEAKTSQALREGLDVRATKSAASSVGDKKKKKKSKSDEDDKIQETPEHNPNNVGSSTSKLHSPPALPKLSPGDKPPRSPSPESSVHFRKRRRMRSSDGGDPTVSDCGAGFQDKFFSDFCPPRAEIGRNDHEAESMDMSATSPRNNHMHYEDDDDDIRAEQTAQSQARGCAGIAMDLVTGAAASSFCIGPQSWRR